MNTKLQLSGFIATIFILAFLGATARSQEAPQDLSPCPGSAAEPTQSSAWSVAFCNRTGHDLVVEFHDNDCPANDWGRRGDVYQRTLKRGESKTLPLCYASEPPARKPAPGVPTLRIQGGKGVTTTWTVVGDCGDHSKPLNMDARNFYDRGDYKTGIILLQYPSGASHCTSDISPSGAASAQPGPSQAQANSSSSIAAPPPTPGPSGPPSSNPQAVAEAHAPVATHSPITSPAAAAQTAPATPAVPRGSGPPTLTAVIDTKSLVQHAVQVLAKGGAGYRCNFNLALTFSDGGSWNDRAKVDITASGSEDAPITTRKYLKSVTDVKITSNTCSPQ